MNRNDSSRRTFLRKLSAASVAAMGIPAMANSTSFSHLAAGGENADEAYWELVRKQFAVEEDVVMFNAANLCPSPYVINEQVLAFQQGLARDVSFQHRAQFADIRKQSLKSLAEFIGVTPSEVGITRNTSEANGILVNGLDFKPGDEIILWDQNHPSNKDSWINRAKRNGSIVKVISVPASPKNVNELITPFEQAITKKTRLISFSHISNVTGIALPAKEICALAKSKGILTLVDGAQSLGYLDLNLKQLGCDFYTSSTHKWLMGPLENGVLYVNESQLDKVWPNVIGAGWHDNATTVDEKLCVLGQRNETTVAALPKVTEFHKTIGKAAVEKRVQFLIAHLKLELASTPGVTIITPMNIEMSGGVLVIQLANKDPRDVFQVLYSKYKIAGAPTVGVRLSPHIYNTMTDADRVIHAIREIAKS